MTENGRSSEAVVTISGEEKDAKSTNVTDHSPHSKVPLPETLTRRKTLARSVYSKPKSRFGEQTFIDTHMFDDIAAEPVGQTSNLPIGVADNTTASSPSATPSKETIRTVSITPKTPLMDEGEVYGEEEIYKEVNLLKNKKVTIKVVLECVVLLIHVGSVVASLTIGELKRYKVWSLELWKWCVLLTVIICGMLITNWLMHFIVLLIELNFLLRRKVLYFVHGLKKSVQVSIWLIVVLVTWIWLFINDQDVDRSKKTTQILDYFTWTIVSLLVGSIFWLLKTLLLKILASSFHDCNSFDRIQESFLQQYFVQNLSGPPVMESMQNNGVGASARHLSFETKRKGGKEAKTKEVVEVIKLHRMKREQVSAWTMKMLVKLISSSGLSTFSGELEQSDYVNRGGETTDKEINNERKAIAAAVYIFKNVARPQAT